MHERLQQDYDRWHEAHAATTSAEEDRFHNWLLSLLDARRGALLDIACGNGRFLSLAETHGYAISGIDLSQVAIELARKRLPNADLRAGAAEALPFEDGSFNAVTCIGSLEHMPDPDAALREMARVLTRDGRAVVFVPNLFFLGHVYFGIRNGTQPSEGEQAFSERFLSAQGWRALMERNGLRVAEQHEWNRIWASRKVGRLTTRIWNAGSRFVPRNAAYAFAFVCAPPDDRRS